MFSVKAPAHPGVPEPLADAVAFIRADLEAGHDLGTLQDLQHAVDAEAAGRKIQDMQKGADERVFRPCALIGDGEGNGGAPSAAGAEGSRYVGGVGGD